MADYQVRFMPVGNASKGMAYEIWRKPNAAAAIAAVKERHAEDFPEPGTPRVVDTVKVWNELTRRWVDITIEDTY